MGMERNSPQDLTIPFCFFLGTAALTGFVLWAAAQISSFVGNGAFLPDDTNNVQSVIDVITKHRGEPATAWSDSSMTGPVFYWTTALLVALLLAAIAIIAYTRFNKHGIALKERDRLGATTEAHMARPRDLKPLIVDGFIPDRFALGKIGRHHLAAENRTSKHDSGPTARRTASNTGDRGPVMFIGPTRSGKTVGVISSILTWGGPIIAASVKGDLIHPTLSRRRQLGETGIFDPTHELRIGYRGGKDVPQGWDERLCVNWSPLAGIRTFGDASRIAANLTETAPGPGGSGGGDSNFWIKSAEEVLAPFLWLAALNGLSFAQVVDWAAARPDIEAAPQQFQGYFTRIASADETLAPTVKRVQTKLYGKLALDQRTLDGVFMTLQTVLQPWATDEVADSASGKSIDLDWLLAGGHESPRSLYLSAPPSEAKRLKAVYSGALSELFRQIYTHTNANGPIEPPLLVVIDEAANMPLPLLQEYTSTLAGLGVQLVTVWQDFGQIYNHYGENAANSIIGNHLSRLFFRGLASPETAKWIEQLTGQEEVENTRTSLDQRGTQTSVDSKRLAILPANVIREQRKFEALLVHGGLKPAHVRAHQWFKDKTLSALNEWKPDFDPDLGLPNPTGEAKRLERKTSVIIPHTPHQPAPPHPVPPRPQPVAAPSPTGNTALHAPPAITATLQREAPGADVATLPIEVIDPPQQLFTPVANEPEPQDTAQPPPTAPPPREKTGLEDHLGMGER